jgi:NAD-dependent SIR2 family protein deacetylase
MVAELIEANQPCVALTGAGISTESGVPDFRSASGVWAEYDPYEVASIDGFRLDPARAWEFYGRRLGVLADIQPNAGHLALAALEQAGLLEAVITQNVDGLHQRAGSSEVLELHGNIHGVLCLDCHASFPRAFVQGMLEELNPGVEGAVGAAAPDGDAHVEPDTLAEFHVPHCLHCGGTLKPDVVFFGDGVAPASTQQALARMEAADALLVVGSSLMVFSGFRFCRMAVASGKPIAAINLGMTRADDLLALKIDGSAEQVLPALYARLVRRAPEQA